MVSNALLFLTTLQMPDISSFIWNMQLWFAVEVCQANKSVSMLYKAQHPENPGTHFLRWRKRTMHVLQLQNIKCNIDSKVDKADSFQKCKPVTTASRNHMAISKEITPHEISFWDVSKKYKISKKSWSENVESLYSPPTSVRCNPSQNTVILHNSYGYFLNASNYLQVRCHSEENNKLDAGYVVQKMLQISTYYAMG